MAASLAVGSVERFNCLTDGVSMQEQRFKVGDKVKAKAGCERSNVSRGHDLAADAIYTIKSFNGSGECVRLEETEAVPYAARLELAAPRPLRVGEPDPEYVNVKSGMRYRVTSGTIVEFFSPTINKWEESCYYAREIKAPDFIPARGRYRHKRVPHYCTPRPSDKCHCGAPADFPGPSCERHFGTFRAALAATEGR